MLRGLDHLVIVVRDLEVAVRQYRALGFTVVPGGRHPTGTHNALIAFADGAYLELLAFTEPNPSHRWWAALEAGGGLADVCCMTDDLAGDTAALRGAGVEMDDPHPLSRIRPDGYTLHWVLATPRGRFRGVAPFLIEDRTPRAERVPPEIGHPNGVTGIDTLTLAVPDAAAVAGWYAAAGAGGPTPVLRAELDAAGLGLTLGPHRVECLAPRSSRSPLAAWLETRGPGPWAAALRTVSAKGPLDPDRTLGARLVLV